VFSGTLSYMRDDVFSGTLSYMRDDVFSGTLSYMRDDVFSVRHQRQRLSTMRFNILTPARFLAGGLPTCMSQLCRGEYR